MDDDACSAESVRPLEGPLPPGRLFRPSGPKAHRNCLGVVLCLQVTENQRRCPFPDNDGELSAEWPGLKCRREGEGGGSSADADRSMHPSTRGG